MIADDGVQLASLELESARRAYTRAVGLVDHRFVQDRARAYALELETHYLFYESEPDEIPSDREVPTAAKLEKSSAALVTAINHYESK